MAQKVKPKVKAEKIDVETEANGFSCINCNGNAYNKVGELPPQYYGGIKDGEEFSVIHRDIVECPCGQKSIVMRYE